MIWSGGILIPIYRHQAQEARTGRFHRRQSAHVTDLCLRMISPGTRVVRKRCFIQIACAGACQVDPEVALTSTPAISQVRNSPCLTGLLLGVGKYALLGAYLTRSRESGQDPHGFRQERAQELGDAYIGPRYGVGCKVFGVGVMWLAYAQPQRECTADFARFQVWVHSDHLLSTL
jgi:hypothetical protein